VSCVRAVSAAISPTWKQPTLRSTKHTPSCPASPSASTSRCLAADSVHPGDRCSVDGEITSTSSRPVTLPPLPPPSSTPYTCSARQCESRRARRDGVVVVAVGGCFRVGRHLVDPADGDAQAGEAHRPLPEGLQRHATLVHVGLPLARHVEPQPRARPDVGVHVLRSARLRRTTQLAHGEEGGRGVSRTHRL
jgi:hypothetical protein